MNANKNIREKAREKGVRFWEIADALGVSEATLTRKLRHELPAAEREKIEQIIDRIHKGR
jgi:hypothetical protein